MAGMHAPLLALLVVVTLAGLAAGRKSPAAFPPAKDFPLVEHLRAEHALGLKMEKSFPPAPATPPVRDAKGGIEMDVFMPSADAIKENTYLCTAKPVPNEHFIVTHVRPVVDMNTVTEVMVYGCREPYTTDTEGWVCDGSHSRCSETDEKEGLRLMYGWTKGTRTLDFPKDQGFEVGWGTTTRWVVVEVHYAEVTVQDMSGVRLMMSSEVQMRELGSLKPGAALKSVGTVNFITDAKPQRGEGKGERKLSFSCCYGGTQALQTFASRVRSHRFGVGAELERVSMDGYGYLDARGRLAPKNSKVVVRRDVETLQAIAETGEDDDTRVSPGETLKLTCQYSATARPEEFERDDREVCSVRTLHYGHSAVDMVCNAGSHIMYPVKPEDEIPPGAPTALIDWGQGFTDTPLGPIGGIGQDIEGNIVVLQRGMQSRVVPRPEPEEGEEAPPPLGPDEEPEVEPLRYWNDTIFHTGRLNGRAVLYEREEEFSMPLRENVVVFLDRSSGKPVAGGNAWGGGQFHIPWGLHVDGEDNVWITDLYLHQVFKFQRSGTLLLEVGTRFSPGGNGTHLCMPTSVATASDGTFYVADGYCGHRIASFGPTGTWRKDLTRKGRMQLNVPDSLALDECAGVLYVADTGNGEVVAFDTGSGNEIFSWDLREHGSVYALARSPGGQLVAATRPHFKGKPTKTGKARLLLLTPRSVSGDGKKMVYSSWTRGKVAEIWEPPMVTIPSALHLSGGWNRTGLNIYLGEARPYLRDKKGHARSVIQKLGLAVQPHDVAMVPPEFFGLKNGGAEAAAARVKHASHAAMLEAEGNAPGGSSWAGAEGGGGGGGGFRPGSIFVMHRESPQVVAVAGGSLFGAFAWLVWRRQRNPVAEFLGAAAAATAGAGAGGRVAAATGGGGLGAGGGGAGSSG